ncbi:Cutinase transcription factor 1 beta like protein [Verticillium longisporum]|uniref:Cutinase transcription factor 1 beta like protein n=1 Tax=Verticillium longisporum TaxID=100787 RepID=A0A8I2ZE08_VERLO|nr:Cutinase transcription factor 1 beta like protein [Verticillium longisporum]
MSSAEDSTPSPDLDLGLDMDLDFDSAPEASALQAVADSMAAENAHTTTTTHMASSDNHDTSGMDTSEDKHDASSPSPAAEDRGSPTPSQNGKKRPSTSSAAEDPNAPPAKVTKRRAARACVSCRARKVRCDVVEGAPCGNCRWDNVECVVQESRRRKKALLTASTAVAVAEAQLRAKGSEGQHHQLHQQHPHHHALHQHPSLAPATANVNIQSNAELRHASIASAASIGSMGAPASGQTGAGVEGGPLNGISGGAEGATVSPDGHVPHMIYQQSALRQDANATATANANAHLLSKLQAAAAQDTNARRLLANLLTRAQAVTSSSAAAASSSSFSSQTSFGDLRTSQFLASLEEPDLQAQLPAFVKPLPARIASEDVKYLHTKGALSLPPLPLQTALLQAYVEYVHPYMPLLDLREFLGAVNARDGLCGQVSLFLYQAIMFAATAFVDMKALKEAGYSTRKAARRSFFSKTRLLYDFDYESDRLVLVQALLLMTYCHMLKAQYSVLIRDKMRPDNTVNSTMMLFPNKKLDNFESVTSVDLELMAWAEALPQTCQYRPLTPLDVKNGRSTLAVQRTLLHMVYYTTISALHRPQFLPSSPSQAPTASRQVQEMSRLRVRDAAMHITRMASELHHLRLEKFLPTTGVTVILPAMIIHLLEMKNPIAQARDRASRGFKQCMRVMEKLREIYAAADYATGFLDAALSKAAIDIGAGAGAQAAAVTQQNLKMANPSFGAQTPPPENAPYMTSSEALFAKPNQVVQATNNTNMVLPQTINAAALDLSASPPSTDKDLESTLGGLTPSASGGSEEPELLDLDFLQGQDDIDWNAMAGTELDMDQWLQFPPEGVNNSDEGLVANVFGEEGMQDAMNWAAAGAGDVKAEMAAAA